MTFVIIMRVTLPGRTPDWKGASGGLGDLARSLGCVGLRRLKTMGGRRDLFLLTDWPTRAKALRFMAAIKSSRSDLGDQHDPLEMRAAAGEDGRVGLHLLMCQELVEALGSAVVGEGRTASS